MELYADAAANLEDAMLSGMGQALLDLEITDSTLLSKINTIARDWAQGRAAEMIGMRVDADGSLVSNPDAEWRIDTGTRKEIRELVTGAFSDETKMSELIADIKEAGSFSDRRADMIGRTEVALAQVSGNYEVWQKSGLVTKVKWLLSADHEDGSGCACEDNENKTVDFGEPFPSDDLMPPAHPNCWCVLLAVGVAGVTDTE